MAASTRSFCIHRHALTRASLGLTYESPAVAKNLVRLGRPQPTYMIQSSRSLSSRTATNINNNNHRALLSSPWLPSRLSNSHGFVSTENKLSTPLIRSYHLSFRTLDQQQRSANSTPEQGISTETEAREKEELTNHRAVEDGFQHQHHAPMPPNTDPKARMMIGFTCTVCDHRSYKTMSKHAYEHGVVIMQCDGCKNRHLIADHLEWFRSGRTTIEDLVREKGEEVTHISRDYRLIKDGQEVQSGQSAATGGEEPPRTELEMALKQAAEGMLEWVPHEIPVKAKDEAAPKDSKSTEKSS